MERAHNEWQRETNELFLQIVDESGANDQSGDAVVLSYRNAQVTRESLRCLLPGKWLNAQR